MQLEARIAHFFEFEKATGIDFSIDAGFRGIGLGLRSNFGISQGSTFEPTEIDSTNVKLTARSNKRLHYIKNNACFTLRKPECPNVPCISTISATPVFLQ